MVKIAVTETTVKTYEIPDEKFEETKVDAIRDEFLNVDAFEWDYFLVSDECAYFDAEVETWP